MAYLKTLITFALLCTSCLATWTLEDLHKSNNAFSVKLFKEYASHSDNPNLIMSPASLYMSLAKLAEGSAGNTHKQLRKVLDLPDNVNGETFKKLINEFHVKKDANASLENQILANEQLRVKPAYERLIENKFNASVTRFRPNNLNETALKVNEWTKKSTNGKIQNMTRPEDIHGLHVMLFSAAHFMATWKMPFPEWATKHEIFHKGGHRFKVINMMIYQADYRYGELKKLKAQFIELPYLNEAYKMTIILPNEASNLEQVIRNFNVSVIENIKREGYKTKVTLSLPKFKIESTLNLNEALQNIGVRDLFSPRVDLTKLMQFGTEIKTVVKQKSLIEVSEKGHELAFVPKSAKAYITSDPASIEFKINRPYLFFITKEDTIVFIGYVKDPVY